MDYRSGVPHAKLRRLLPALGDRLHFGQHRIALAVRHTVNVVDHRLAVFDQHIEVYLRDGVLDLRLIDAGPHLEGDGDIRHAVLDGAGHDFDLFQRAAILRIGDDVVTEGIAGFVVFRVIGGVFGRLLVGRLEALAVEAGQIGRIENVLPFGIDGAPVVFGNIHDLFHRSDDIGSGCGGSEKGKPNGERNGAQETAHGG